MRYQINTVRSFNLGQHYEIIDTDNEYKIKVFVCKMDDRNKAELVCQSLNFADREHGKNSTSFAWQEME